jgi:fumarylacetoacetate (FAA) hydrolase family protein
VSDADESLSPLLPVDGGTLVGRLRFPGSDLPRVVVVSQGLAYDISRRYLTVAQLLNEDNALVAAQPIAAVDPVLGPAEALTRDSLHRRPESTVPSLLAPCDLQAIKASGVTFLISLQERVIEEAVRGEAARAQEIRARLQPEIDSALRGVRPGTPAAERAKAWLTERGLWSQYLEVAIGPDAEIFTKAQPMSSVGFGSDIGILRSSVWNNPEPEIVLAVNARGEVIGATLGNDVNLRDIEGRSGLLLGKAKDNNGSCAIGPFIRLFDETFGIDEVRSAEVELSIRGPDRFELHATSQMSLISRDPLDLVRQAIGRHHQYPDGFMLFLGSMFAPTQDRDEPGKGFTHHPGDVVVIRTPRLGTLVNRVSYCDTIAPWTYGFSALLKSAGAKHP